MPLPKPTTNLALTDLNEELLIFNGITNKASCLGKAGRAVFLACQQESSQRETLELLARMGFVDPAIALEESLNQLHEEGLIEAPEASFSSFDRRKFLATAAAAIALPVISSVVAPRPVAASSCTLCPVDTNGVPNEGGNAITGCATCGQVCQLTPGSGCGTLICNFEYILFNLNPTAPVGDCAIVEGAAAQYRCRSTAGRIYDTDCGTARSLALARVGAGIGDAYYCCTCNLAPGPSRQSCP
jgi:hypothetical protein